MRPEVILAIYCGSLFSIVFLIAPVLLRTKENKNLAGRFYGIILWRFYKVAFLLLMLYLIFGEKYQALLLMLGLSLNMGVSFWLKDYKRKLGNIDLLSYEDPKRRIFRRVSFLSTLLLFLNFLLSLYILLNSIKGGLSAGV